MTQENTVWPFVTYAQKSHSMTAAVDTSLGSREWDKQPILMGGVSSKSTGCEIIIVTLLEVLVHLLLLLLLLSRFSPTLCDPIDSSPPGSPIPGILQARTLEWIAIFFSNASK